MRYKIDTSDKTVVEVYGTPKNDPKGIKVGKDMWIIARHIWGEKSRYVRYADVSGIVTTSIKMRFISGQYMENYRRAKLLVAVWKYAYNNIPITNYFFPERKSKGIVNEDYDSIILEAATLYKKYHERNIKQSTSGLRMLNRALNQEPNEKILTAKPRERDKAEKLIDRMLKEDIGIINAINDVFKNTLYIDERGDLKSIGGKEKANQAIRRIIKRQFLKRYKVTK